VELDLVRLSSSLTCCIPGGLYREPRAAEEQRRVTLFACDVDEGRSEHTAPFDALVVVTDGVADIEIASESFRVHQGETIILPVNKPLAVRAATRFKMLLIMIRA
jgi:quercetin dioxygenase-like cupin family protein